MGLLFRGIVWFSVYILLAALPLFVAAFVDPFPAPRSFVLELSVGLGLVAFALMSMQFALVNRLEAASKPFGTDSLMQFHRQLGITALAFILLHPVLLVPEGVGLGAWSPLGGSAVSQSGAVALWAAVAIGVTSLFRRRLHLSYPAWNVIHLAGALVVVGAMFWHVLAVAGYSGEPVMRWLLAGYVVLVIALLVRYRVLRPIELWRHPWEVVANRDEGADTRSLVVRPVGHEAFRFQAGQFAWIDTGRTPFAGEQHPLTISSTAESMEALEFSIKALGDWSGESVPLLSEGSRVWVDGPYGVFTPERVPGQGLVLIAGGIGISPMRSMLETMRDRGDRRHVVLFYAANALDRTIFREELETLQQQIALDLVYVFENPGPGDPGEHGRIDEDILGRHLPEYYRHYQFFICGPVPMLEALERLLVRMGVPSENVNTERFDMV